MAEPITWSMSNNILDQIADGSVSVAVCCEGLNNVVIETVKDGREVLIEGKRKYRTDK